MRRSAMWTLQVIYWLTELDKYAKNFAAHRGYYFVKRCARALGQFHRSEEHALPMSNAYNPPSETVPSSGRIHWGIVTGCPFHLPLQQNKREGPWPLMPSIKKSHNPHVHKWYTRSCRASSTGYYPSSVIQDAQKREVV